MKAYQRFQQQWFEVDRKYLDQSYSILDDISKFQCADFELDESECIKSLPNNLNWDDIKINNNINYKNNNNNDEKSENDNNHNIILKNKII